MSPLWTNELMKTGVAAGIIGVTVLASPVAHAQPLLAGDGAPVRANQEQLMVATGHSYFQDKDKVRFQVVVMRDVSSFHVVYRPVDAELGPAKSTPEVDISGAKLPKQFPDSKGGYPVMKTEKLRPKTMYEYRFVGQLKDKPGEVVETPWQTFVSPDEEGVYTGTAKQDSVSKSTGNFQGGVVGARTDGSLYIRYGTNPRDLDEKTEKRDFVGNGLDSPYIIPATFLEPKTRIYYQPIADFADGRHGEGMIRSYEWLPPEIDAKNPCPSLDFAPTRLSRDVAIVCAKHKDIPSGINPVAIPEVSGTLLCPKDFPRNLNTSKFSVKLPKIGLPITVDIGGASIWRTSNDVRWNFVIPWTNTGDEGQQSPLRQGSQPYSSLNWSVYPQSLNAWIYCSRNWSAPADQQE